MKLRDIVIRTTTIEALCKLDEFPCWPKPVTVELPKYNFGYKLYIIAYEAAPHLARGWVKIYLSRSSNVREVW